MPKTEDPPSTVDEKAAAMRAKNLDLAIQQIEKDYGSEAIRRLGDATVSAVEVIPTGNILIDRALGVGGFPRGRVVEIFGPESSGKTTLTLTAIAQAQRNGGMAGFIDVEHALDPGYAQKLGVNLDDLLVSQPSSGEEALRICETLVRSNALDVIVIDSVAALVTKSELEGEIGDAVVGAQARLMSNALRKLTSFISRARTVCIFTNQIREKIGVMFGNPETTPGGKALKFYASVRVDIRRIGAIKNSDGTVRATAPRSKLSRTRSPRPSPRRSSTSCITRGFPASARCSISPWKKASSKNGAHGSATRGLSWRKAAMLSRRSCEATRRSSRRSTRTCALHSIQ